MRGGDVGVDVCGGVPQAGLCLSGTTRQEPTSKSNSCVAQRKRAGLITRRSLDRNESQLISKLLHLFSFFSQLTFGAMVWVLGDCCGSPFWGRGNSHVRACADTLLWEYHVNRRAHRVRTQQRRPFMHGPWQPRSLCQLGRVAEICRLFLHHLRLRARQKSAYSGRQSQPLSLF